MAEFSDQSPLNCPICIEHLKDPVTIACGHSFCMNCIKQFWDQNDRTGVYSCPQCRQVFSPRPALNRSTVLAELVEKMKREVPQGKKDAPLMCSAGSGDVECDVCVETKLKAVKFCLVCVASFCESHIQAHYTSLALKRHKLVNASPHLLEQICSQHDKPLELYCCQDKQLICMQCALINHQNHSMASPAARRKEIQEQLKSNQHDLQDKINLRELKLEEIKQAIGHHKRSAQAAVEHSEKIFMELMKKQAEITEKIRSQEKAEKIKAEELIHTLEQEISDLRRRNKELGQVSQIEDDICFIQKFSSIYNYQCSNLCSITINQHLTFEEIQPILCELKSQLGDVCEQEVIRISEKVPTVHIILNDEKITEYLPSRPKTREEFLIYSSKPCLNQQSASAQLSLNGNNVSRCDSLQSNVIDQSGFSIGRSPRVAMSFSSSSQGFHFGGPNYQTVTHCDSLQSNVIDQSGFLFGRSPQKAKVFGSSSQNLSFGGSTYQTSTYQVLCDKSLSGCCYFEVEYTGTGCSIAFSYDQFNQAGGNFTFGCNNRSWIFHFSKADIDMSHNNSSISTPVVSSKIGVYLDHSAGTLSFYSVSDKMTLLHRIQTTFTEPLYPGFSFQKWGNGSSVNICDLPLKSK